MPPPMSKTKPLSKATVPPHIVQLCDGIVCPLAKKLSRLRFQTPFTPFLDLPTQGKLGVVCKNFDPTDQHASEFWRPIELDQMKALLAEFKPWEECGTGVPRWSKLPEGKWQNAMHLNIAIVNFLYHGKDASGTEGLIFSDQTKWDSYRRLPCQVRFHTTEVSFDCGCIYEYEDTAFPHITAVMNQSVSLDDDSIGMTELLCLTRLTAVRLMKSEYHRHKVFPITLVSIADCQIRIIVGHVDLQTKGIKIMKSPLITFDDEQCCMRDDWTRILGWLLAEPRMPLSPRPADGDEAVGQ